MDRPFLRRIPLEFALPLQSGHCYITLSPGQWDGLLRSAYEMGWTLLEIDESENVIAAYQRFPDHERSPA